MNKLRLFDVLKGMKDFKIIRTAVISSLITVVLIFLLIFGLFITNRNGILEYLTSYAAKTDPAAMTSSLVTFNHDVLVENAVQKANPAVMSVIISKDLPSVQRYYGSAGPFSEIFGSPTDQSHDQPTEVGGGTAFFISPNGLAVTNRHVVDDPAASYTALLNDGSKHNIKVMAKDPVYDIALIQVDGSNFSYLSLGDSNSIKVGESIIAIGNALGEYRNTVSVGVVSGLARTVVAGNEYGQAEQLDQVIQTDAAINPGNSGGPLLDLSGNVIGMNTAIIAGSSNIAFAIPSNAIKSVVNSVQQYGKIIRPYLGVRYLPVSTDVQTQYSLPVDYGAFVTQGSSSTEPAVISGSPADKAGIQENDIILKVNGQTIDNNKTTLSTLIRQMKVGDVVTLTFLRNGETREVQARLEAAPPS